MCTPAIGAVIGIMSQFAQFGAEQQDYAAQKHQYDTNVVNARAAAMDEQRQLQLRSMQEQEATEQKIFVSRIEEAGLKAEAALSAADAGVAGNSVSNIITDIERRGAYQRAIEDRNFHMTVAQINEELKATKTTAINRINSVTKPNKPSILKLALGVAGAGIRLQKGA